jgi:hypothetical protein
MDAREMSRYVSTLGEGIRVADNEGDSFFLYDPDGDLPPERQFPFVTIVTGDRYDSVSDLDRPGAYRLNIGLTKATYAGLFGAGPDGGYDYAARDVLMPHPVYAGQHWVCVVNPGEATLDAVGTLLAEAYAFAARRYANRARR